VDDKRTQPTTSIALVSHGLILNESRRLSHLAKISNRQLSTPPLLLIKISLLPLLKQSKAAAGKELLMHLD